MQIVGKKDVPCTITDYICEACNASFVSLFDLAEHGNFHTGNRPFACPICLKKFYYVREYVEHYKNSHVTCQHCMVGFIDRKALENHTQHCFPSSSTVDMTVIKELTPLGNEDGSGKSNTLMKNNKLEKEKPKRGRKPLNYECESCKESFTKKVHLKRHGCISRAPQKSILCSCLQSFERVGDFRTHVGIKPHTCCACQMPFSKITNLIKHIRSHTKEKPYVCGQCGRAFSQDATLRNHQSIHQGKMAAKCRLCPFSCQTPSGLFKHMQKHKSGEPVVDKRKISLKNHSCSTCGIEFKFLRNLANHIKVHSATQFLCPHCGQVFDKRYNLSSHIRITHGPLLECSLCDKKVRGKPALRTHIRTHTNSKNYKCSVCDKRFALASYLRCHLRTHDKSRPIQVCLHCGKEFKLPQSLKSHIEVSCPVLFSKKDESNYCGPDILNNP